MTKSITVVYQINDQNSEAAQNLYKNIRDLFTSDSESLPVSVTASSNTDEMTKLELVEFYLACDDTYLAKQVIEEDDITKHLNFYKSVTKYADQNSVTQLAAYEAVEFIA